MADSDTDDDMPPLIEDCEDLPATAAEDSSSEEDFGVDYFPPPVAERAAAPQPPVPPPAPPPAAPEADGALAPAPVVRKRPAGSMCGGGLALDMKGHPLQVTKLSAMFFGRRCVFLDGAVFLAGACFS